MNFSILKQKILLFLLGFALGNPLLSDEENNGGDVDLGNLKQETLFISLGSTCRPAGLLRTFELRKAAFPFDWVLSVDSEKLLEILEDEFLEFTNEDYLVPDNYLMPNASGAGLYHIWYHLEFLHDGDWTGAAYSSNMEKFKSKYERRIERFKSLRDYKGKVIFVRTSWPEAHSGPGIFYKCQENNEISEHYAFRLSSTLRKFFPKLNFILVVINFDVNPKETLIERELPDGSIEIRIAPEDFVESLKKFFLRLYLESL